MTRARDRQGRYVPADQLATARLDGRAALQAELLGPEDESSLGMSIIGALEAERDLKAAIGSAYCDHDESTANDMRDRLYRFQTLREICERLLEQVRR